MSNNSESASKNREEQIRLEQQEQEYYRKCLVDIALGVYQGNCEKYSTTRQNRLNLKR